MVMKPVVEGCFTASCSEPPLRGLTTSVEFNVTQSTDDFTLLTALNGFFNYIGYVYNKPNNVSVLVFRNLKIILSVIVPFFQQFPLITLKGLEFFD